MLKIEDIKLIYNIIYKNKYKDIEIYIKNYPFFNIKDSFIEVGYDKNKIKKIDIKKEIITYQYEEYSIKDKYIIFKNNEKFFLRKKYYYIKKNNELYILEIIINCQKKEIPYIIDYHNQIKYIIKEIKYYNSLIEIYKNNKKKYFCIKHMINVNNKKTILKSLTEFNKNIKILQLELNS